MFELKPCCIKDCKSRGVRYLASADKPEGAWYCYSHADDVQEGE